MPVSCGKTVLWSELFGEIALLDGSEGSADVTAATDWPRFALRSHRRGHYHEQSPHMLGLSRGGGEAP